MNVIHVAVESKKYGLVWFTIDEDDLKKMEGWSFYIWGTPRHSGLYVHAYSPTNRKVPQRLHRVVMNAKPGEIVDHIDRDPLNNSKSNLRLTTSTINNQNARKRKDGVTSKYKGVHWASREKRWKAQIQVNGRKKALGSYRDEASAAQAYNTAIDIHGIRSPKNIIDLK